MKMPTPIIKQRRADYIFLAVCLLNLLPALSFTYFPSLDGPAHLYNANLIPHLLWADGSGLAQNFIFNPQPVPNWTGHLLLALLGSVLPAFLAEKALLLFYLIGFPLAFRSLIKTVAPQGSLWSFLIFPFCYSFIFFLGFYNFLIGLVLMLWFVKFWIEKQFRFNAQEAVLAFAALLLLYFSHLFLFGFALLVCGLLALGSLVTAQGRFSQAMGQVVKRVAILALLALPGLALAAWFFINHQGHHLQWLPKYELVQWLKQLRPLIGLSYEDELPYTGKIAYFVIFATALALFFKVDGLVKKLKEHKNAWAYLAQNLRDNLWLLIALVALALYFVLPDSNGYSGFISVRLCLLFFLFLIVWISGQKLPRWFALAGVALTLICSFMLNRYYFQKMGHLNQVALEVAQLSDKLNPGESVLPLNYSGDWLQGHFSNYLGIEKPVVILENYEAAMDYFPLKWNDPKIPHYRLNGLAPGPNAPCANWRSNPQNPAQVIDHVLVLGQPDWEEDNCRKQIWEELSTSYKLVFEGKYSSLYSKD